jgi:hypothetical protein
MQAFRVWVRPLDYEYQVCVDGVDNARWLIDQLGRSFIFRSAKPINEQHNSTLCTFQVPSNALLPFAQFQRTLAAIPEVTLLRTAVAAN